MKTETREIVKDLKGIEYYLIKANRVNWIVERVSDGARLQGKARMFTPVGIKQVEVEATDPRVRIGAIVRVKADSALWSYSKFNNEYEFEQQFFVMGFGKALGEFKIINVGGNLRNSYYTIHGKDLSIA